MPTPSDPTPAPRAFPRWKRAAGIAAAALLTWLLLRTFVAGVYRVDSGSMEPFLHGARQGGELVLVLYRREQRPRRFDAVVLRRPGERDPVVKRVAGLPGESVAIAGGDLVVDGARLGPEEPHPELVSMFDSQGAALEGAFKLAPKLWVRSEHGWTLDARSIETAASAAAATWPVKLLDDRLDERGASVRGKREIGDAALELEFTGAEGSGRITLRLTEEGDVFDAEVDLAAGQEAVLRLTRRAFGAPETVLCERTLALDAQQRHRLRLSNVDNQVALDVDQERAALHARYERNTALGSVPDPAYRHVAPRMAFGAAGLRLEILRVRVLRDLHYTERGTFGVQTPQRLGPDEYFVLGDNSTDSLDSRDYGPVSRRDLIGVPAAVVWPPSAWRWLARRAP